MAVGILEVGDYIPAAYTPATILDIGERLRYRLAFHLREWMLDGRAGPSIAGRITGKWILMLMQEQLEHGHPHGVKWSIQAKVLPARFLDLSTCFLSPYSHSPDTLPFQLSGRKRALYAARLPYGNAGDANWEWSMADMMGVVDMGRWYAYMIVPTVYTHQDLVRCFVRDIDTDEVVKALKDDAANDS
jgi:hypothetical protein